jgi:ADP-ribose pyrophosphatase YjhB (NUDIX family)
MKKTGKFSPPSPITSTSSGIWQWPWRDGSGERAVLVGVDQGEGVQAEVDLAELAELARTAGAVVAHKELVFRPSLDPRYAVGRGKVEELVSHAYHQNAGTLIFGIDLSAAQARELETITGLKVLDRTQLILDIFAQHARTPEAKVVSAPVGRARPSSRSTAAACKTASPNSPASCKKLPGGARRPAASGINRACPLWGWWVTPTPARPP